MSAARKKGTAWETALLPWLRRRWPDCRRTGSARPGAGDFEATAPCLIEAKAHRAFDLAGWIDQAQAAARRTGQRAVVVVKRPGRPVADAYVLLTLADWLAEWPSAPEGIPSSGGAMSETSESFAYVAHRDCGCLCAAAVDRADTRRDVARETAEWLRAGLRVERVPCETVRRATWGCARCLAGSELPEEQR